MALPFSDLQPEPLFPLGRVTVTSAAERSLAASGESVEALLARHRAGDWGDVSDATREANRDALVHGHRLESIFHTALGEKILVVTEPDRSLTSVMHPEEF